MNCTGKRLKVIYGDLTLGVSGEGFHYIFSYATGGLESLCIHGLEWLYRTPGPTFWRALTDNDRGNGFHLKSGMWLAADTFIRCVDSVVSVDGKKIEKPVAPENNKYTGQETAENVALMFTYETITIPKTRVETTYTVNALGEIRVRVKYHGQSGLPELPVLGMRFVMPSKAEGYTYEGLSGETYPDRMAGGIPGVYEVQGMPVTPYLVPQDCGVHMDTKWVDVFRKTSLDNSRKKECLEKLRFSETEGKIAFSCLPYTAEELENATHQEELPPARRTVLCIYGAVRGVGGIDSWGSDVEESCHISGEQDLEYSFQIAFDS